MTTLVYGNRPDWTTSLTYWNGSTESFLHCGKCLSIIPEPSAGCRHCGNAREKSQKRLEEFLRTKNAEEFI